MALRNFLRVSGAPQHCIHLAKIIWGVRRYHTLKVLSRVAAHSSAEAAASSDSDAAAGPEARMETVSESPKHLALK